MPSSALCHSMTSRHPKEEWNDDPTDWPKIIHQYEFDWCTPDVVYVAEYYKVEEKTETIRIFQTITGRRSVTPRPTSPTTRPWKKPWPPLAQSRFASARSSASVHKYIMSGGKVLEDAGYIAGKCIPSSGLRQALVCRQRRALHGPRAPGQGCAAPQEHAAVQAG
jgi:hypothetical protein